VAIHGRLFKRTVPAVVREQKNVSDAKNGDESGSERRDR
jgi:hypothetical protein